MMIDGKKKQKKQFEVIVLSLIFKPSIFNYDRIEIKGCVGQ